MKRRRLTPVAVLLTTAFLGADVAAEPVDPVGERYAGFTCGFTSTNDPTGQVEQNPDIQQGEADGGPWTVVGASSVTITCTISVGDGIIDGGDTSVTQTTSASVGAVAGTIRYTATAGQDVYLCTQVSWTYDSVAGVVNPGGGSWPGFTDDPDGNPLCDLATSVEPGPGPEVPTEAGAVEVFRGRDGVVRHRQVGGNGDVRTPGWACSSTSSPTLYTVTCTPPNGNQDCKFAYVMAEYVGNPVNTITATTDCGGLVVSCSPNQATLVQNHCEEHAAGTGSTPFVCRVEILPSTNPVENTTTQWSATCLNTRPDTAVMPRSTPGTGTSRHVASKRPATSAS